MDDKTIRLIQREGAEALLDAGVSVPLSGLRLPFRRKPLRLTLRRPTLGGQIALAREWLKMGCTLDSLWQMTKEDEMRLLAEHGKTLSRMVAICLCRGTWRRRLLVRPWAWVVREWMPAPLLCDIIRKFVALMGTDPFLDIIRSAEAVNPMKLRLSQKTEGS